MICAHVKETDDLDVSKKLVRKVMKEDLRLSFVKAKKL